MVQLAARQILTLVIEVRVLVGEPKIEKIQLLILNLANSAHTVQNFNCHTSFILGITSIFENESKLVSSKKL